MSEIPVVTIDGPGGAGKGTVSRRVADELGWHLLDSGALYRLTALAAERRGVAFDDVAGLTAVAEQLAAIFIPDSEGTCILLENDDVTREIRHEHVGGHASQVASMPSVRQALLARQRAFAVTPGLVADGRDMGTVVFPEASLKIYLTASAEERARRRYQQLQSAGHHASLPNLLEEIQARDARDMQREVAPLVAARDAIVLDTTELAIPDVVARIGSLLAERGLKP